MNRHGTVMIRHADQINNKAKKERKKDMWDFEIEMLASSSTDVNNDGGEKRRRRERTGKEK